MSRARCAPAHTLARVAVAVAFLVAAPPTASAGPDRFDTGIQDPLVATFSESDPGAAFDAVRSMGASVVRVPVSWESLAPTEPAAPRDPADPAYDWTWLDERVSAIARSD